MKYNKDIAVCGLNCRECDIFRAPNEPEVAKKLAKQFEGKWENIKPEDFSCDGCRGDRSKCWSTECWIRECCVDNKSLDFCYECQEFPCSKLEDWANQNEGYKEALNRLRKIRREIT